MNKKFLLSALISIVVLQAYAENDGSGNLKNNNHSWVIYDTVPFIDNYKTERDRKNIITLAPLKPFLKLAGIEMGYERVHNKKYATFINLNYGLGNLEDYMNRFLYQIAIGQKYYLDHDAPYGWYTALELRYVQHQYRMFITNTSMHDSLTIHQTFKQASLNMGYQWVKNRFTIDAYVGIGPRIIHTTYYKYDEPDVPKKINLISGRTRRFTLPLNVRIGFRI